MDTLKEFKRILEGQTEIALATSVDEVPNVRIVNYYFNPDNNILYFATFKGNDKTKEIKANQNVAFTTIPHKENEHVKAKGIASKSKQTIFDLTDCFVKKIPGYQDTIDYAGKSLIVYEIAFDTAIVTLDLSTIKTIKL
ncbi:pyridoxamine 5'-phosphate oxidase family protein [Clostridioides mangenotii]|uniref:pyridoxamine 5'-phosphate oxidase family protein n=1 Tax=Metaclostridioides mangenotii TaxID=1540 RepID=UPI001C0F4064|nr:pyridoxamine 5'-phosphate oxidase family protein [Clostridioides mangenotii]MBU5307012.1 pyridoxamine 5'-phosphate oxidase family protein [Clostridioides mangenotii]